MTAPDQLYDAYFFDLDGTIFLGESLLTGATAVAPPLDAPLQPTFVLDNLCQLWPAGGPSNTGANR